jgi:hypothetical protein
VHYQQIREAAQSAQPSQDEDSQEDSQHEDEYLPLVVRTFMWGFPHQYQAPAQAGTAIGLEIVGVGTWTLTRSDTGWVLDEGGPADPAARLQMTGGTAWRLLTGAPYDRRQVRLSGEPALAQPLLQVRGIIV